MSKLTPDDLLGRPDPALSWIKSSLSFANSNCVEVADLPGGQVGVRHSKDADGPVLRFTPGEWHAFLGGAQNGEFDHFGMLWALGAGRHGALVNLAVFEIPGEGPCKQFWGLRPLHAGGSLSVSWRCGDGTSGGRAAGGRAGGGRMGGGRAACGRADGGAAGGSGAGGSR